MKKNMGNVDRSIRIIAAVIIAVLYFTGTISGVLAVILGIIAIIFIFTSFMGSCLLYFPFKINTKKSETPTAEG